MDLICLAVVQELPLTLLINWIINKEGVGCVIGQVIEWPVVDEKKLPFFYVGLVITL